LVSFLDTKLVLGVCALALGGAVLAMANRFYDLALQPKGKGVKHPKAHPRPDDALRQPLSEGRRWLSEHPRASHVSITACDGLRLHACLLERPSHRWAVCVHGYWDTAAGMGYWARHYDELGWNCLLPDLRGHGMSEGNYIGLGWLDRLDIGAWLEWILRRDPDAEIVLHGVSMGRPRC
jgi:pimeloyl-ACP methyl ester carboxylesterase